MIEIIEFITIMFTSLVMGVFLGTWFSLSRSMESFSGTCLASRQYSGYNLFDMKPLNIPESKIKLIIKQLEQIEVLLVFLRFFHGISFLIQ